MSWECPHGFESYRDVMLRIGEVRRDGQYCSFRCLYPDRHKHGDRNWSGRAWIGENGSLIARCYGCGAGFTDMVLATGTKPQDWFPKKLSKQEWVKLMNATMNAAKLVATYKYLDRDGNLRYEKQRYEPGFDGRGKSLRFRRPMPERLRGVCKIPPGAESWVYGIQGQEYGRRQGKTWDWFPVKGDHQEAITIDQADPILYRLPELVAARPDLPVLVVEGEKDVEILRGLGFIATCGPYGSSHWLAEWSKELAGRRVVVVPDNDVVGLQHADLVTGSVIRHGAASVRVVKWDDGLYNPGEGGGIGNWLPLVNPHNDRTVGRNAVIDLCKAAEEYTRPARVEPADVELV